MDGLLLLQVTRFPQTKAQQLEVEPPSIWKPAQSWLLYTLTFIREVFLKSNPFQGVLFRYLNTK